MSFRFSVGLCFGLIALLGSPAFSLAHPVTYAGGTSLTAWTAPGMQDYGVSHSLTRNFSLAGRALSFGESSDKRQFYFPQATWLVRRWNEKSSQSNLYLSGGYGGEVGRFGRGGSGATVAGLEADSESRKVYGSIKVQSLFGTTSDSLTYYRARAGFAPYLGEFEDLSIWAILQAERQRESMDGIELTPLLRFYYRNVLWEVGSSTRGNVLFNFMVHL